MESGATIDGLAEHTGVPASTIRMYQHIGILHPPRRDGRIGLYNVKHVERIGVILELKELGFSLSGIRVLLDPTARNHVLTQVLGDEGQFDIEPATDADLEFISVLLDTDNEESSLREAMDLQLLESGEDGRPRVHRAAFELARFAVELGVSPDLILKEAQFLRDATSDLAAHYLDLLQSESVDRNILAEVYERTDQSDARKAWILMLGRAIGISFVRAIRSRPL